MIVYSATRAEFTRDVFSNQIEQKILDALKHGAGRSMIASWRNSMQYMNNVLLDGGIAEDAGVAIEYMVPLTSKRVDFILTGQDADNRDTAIIVELKQWTDVRATAKDAIVETWVGNAVREVTHPSYQAWTYAALIRDFNATVQDDDISLHACAYLHNCAAGDVINAECYAAHTAKAPAFLRDDSAALRDFLCRYVRRGDRSRILYRIDHGRLRPSKSLVDHLLSLLQGNREFEMIDDQKVVYEAALALSQRAADGRKQVLLVEGGPGTGKSVLAVNLLVEFTRRGRLVHYVTRNAAPREVYQSRLTKSFTKTHISNLFKGSGAYVDTPLNLMDVLVVDEAHRLNEKSGLYQNTGENQVKEIIQAARFSVFFIDEDQRVTLRDIGEKAEIRRWAELCGAEVTELALESQFRCNGSDGYLAWVDHALRIRETANPTLEGIAYDFRVCGSPNELFDVIVKQNAVANKARVVAGYCWAWKGKKDPAIRDVVIEKHGFAKRWNLDKDGSLWLVAPNSVEEIGCIHTCQGLELDYVGVIIGPDLIVRDGRVITDAGQRSGQDRSIHGYKKLLKEAPVRARALGDRIIKNTYRTLMTRGQKGCYVFCVDDETNSYFAEFAESLRTPRAYLEAAERDRGPVTGDSPPRAVP
ncbi:MAG: DNA/RNA helicase domain-containing protein [Woeseia sp.]